MKKGKFESGKSFAFGKKALVLVLAMTLLLGGVIGGTIAYLTSTTNTLTNVFTTSHVKLELTEPAGEANSYSFKMVPGHTITKDPTITVLTGSEPCLVFVKIEEANNTLGAGEKFLTYTMADGWIAGTGTEAGGNGVPVGVYYRNAAATVGDEIQVFEDDKVTVNPNMTEAHMNSIDTGSKPQFLITAYGVQYYTDGTTPIEPSVAWAAIGS